MEPRYARSYLAEFMRVLRPGGTAVFQVPAAHHPRPVEPLPDGAFRAAISISEAPRALKPGNRVELQVAVRNDSHQRWPSGQEIRLGNHWRQGRRLVCRDDGRTVLPELAPGAEVGVRLPVRAPERPGRYSLELDVVQEGIAWFADRGSSPLSVTVKVGSSLAFGPRRPSAHVEEVVPHMEMHCIPREEVEATVATAGGRVVGAQEREDCGEDYDSHCYVAVKTS
jgi:SAM-dependent methyltransferase